jgi:membrane associated rhomboid family serine protease
MMHIIMLLAVLALVSAPAYAYVSPGLGAGALGLVFGFFGAIILALTAILYYPIKRALRRLQKTRAADNSKPS